MYLTYLHDSTYLLYKLLNWFPPPLFRFVTGKVKLVKGPTPLVHHRFYLDIQKHQLANKIEYTIKELGGVSITNGTKTGSSVSSKKLNFPPFGHLRRSSSLFRFLDVFSSIQTSLRSLLAQHNTLLLAG